MTSVAVSHKATTNTQYTGLDDGAVPVKVYRKAAFTVAHVAEPVKDTFFNNEFRTVKFVDQATSELFTNTLFAGHYDRLAADLVEGNTVVLEYEVGTNWIKSINGKVWN